MPTHIRAACSWQTESLLPRDVAVINPCFRHQNVLPFDDVAWQTLADDLSAAIGSWTTSVGRQLTIKLYEIKDPVPGTPNRPKATKVTGAGTSFAGNTPPETALCLSFYGGNNDPSNRGRLYVPVFAFTSSASLGNRPDSTMRTKVGALAPIFAALGGVNVDWIVWSGKKKAATKVDHWFVDDEWDIQRRRGYKPTTRTAGTTGG